MHRTGFLRSFTEVNISNKERVSRSFPEITRVSKHRMRFTCRNVASVPATFPTKKLPRKRLIATTRREEREKPSTRMVFSCTKNVWNDIFREWIIAAQKQEARKRGERVKERKREYRRREKIAQKEREREREKCFIRPSAAGNINYWLAALLSPHACGLTCRI